MIFPKHLTLTLTHNEHKNYYQTVQESIDMKDRGYTEWVSPEQKQKAIDMDECWTLQWYPDTPVGFNILAAADLDVLLLEVQR